MSYCSRMRLPYDAHGIYLARDERLRFCVFNAAKLESFDPVITSFTKHL